MTSIWREERISAGRIRIAAFVRGPIDPHAPTTLFVHGLGHWSRAAWDGLAARLGTGRRIVAFDLPGFGASEKPNVPYTLARFDGALDAVARDLAPGRFALVGHSLGGLVAANYAAARPERVRALALLAPVGFLRTPALALRILVARFAENAIVALPPSRRLTERTLRLGVYDAAALEPSVVARAYELARDRDYVRAFVRTYAGVGGEFSRFGALHARLGVWRGPTLLVWGREDRYVPVRALARARTVYPQATVLEIARCGHCPQIEMPRRVAGALDALDPCEA